MNVLKKNRVVFLALLFILVFMLLPFGQRRTEKPATASNEIMRTVSKIHDSNQFSELQDMLNDSRLQGATTTISIRNATSGEIIYEQLGDTRVHPASVMKLLTGAAALETLGQDYSFKTELYTDGEIRDGELHGNLYLRGQGDPTLTKPDLRAFVSELKTQGIQVIKGNVYGDDTWYDNVRLSQDLNWSDELVHTGAQVSALTLSPNNDYDAGTVIVEATPAKKAGQAGKVSMVPANRYMTVVNHTKTVAKGGKKSMTVERRHGTNTLVVSGTIPVGAKKTRSWASVWEPTNYTVSLFKQTIEEQGITFSTTSKVEIGIVPKGATLLTVKQSMPLSELYIPFMKLSNNGHAEVLVKEMGQVVGGQGSWNKGLAVMETTLADMGMDMTTLLLRDGSGMSHKNLVTANEVTRLLYAAQSKSWYPVFLNSLPVAGNEERFVGGTLRNRMRGTEVAGNVRAKTGLLNGVTALSGYVETKSGETLIFSIMVNNYLSGTVSEVVDEIVIMLANY
ncbi:D-alanyl-D-alanine carboxypeptidase/D-alanyl-D-alanine endopeptidase [Sporosarcina sp. FSL K6-3457]|uniref:D-alanyl-D-alanine carboxypeptidase/D-alanyl-D-alanine endopeptidase n=1 Tax=Sporosarcina sp. FSL K6-3457 TaxID=2978204 RepID=UPI0030FAF882